MSKYPVVVVVEGVDAAASCDEDYGFRLEASVSVDGHPHTVRVTADYGNGEMAREADPISAARASWLINEIADFLRSRR